MTPRIFRRLGFPVVASLMLAALSACSALSVGAGTPSNTGVPAATATTPQLPTATATSALPGAPAGWSVYHNFGFAVAYPSDAGMGENSHNSSVVFYNARLTIMQVGGDPSFCALAPGESWVTLAGLTMKYSNPEGVHRVWFFQDSNQNGYQIEADDGFPTSTSQDVQQDDAILATLKLDDSTPGCPNWGQ